MPTLFNSTSRIQQDLNQSFKLQSLAQRCKVSYENKQFVAEAVKNDGSSLLQKAQQERVFLKNGGGLAAFWKFRLFNADTSKIIYLQRVSKHHVPFSASRCGKSFSPHFPQTENGPGFELIFKLLHKG
jgi:hypothetical protein